MILNQQSNTGVIRFCFFRHGETDWNSEKRFQGNTDIPLNKNGRHQAQLLRPFLAKFGPDAVLSSDLGRARETADIATSGMSVSRHVIPELRECFFGAVEGMTRDEIVREYGEETLRKFFSPRPADLDAKFELGETKREHLARVLGFLTTWVKDVAFSRVAVSTHAGVIWRLLSTSPDYSETAPLIPNCAPFLFELDRSSGRLKYLPTTSLEESTEQAFEAPKNVLNSLPTSNSTSP
jgi:probable phosphoglycerate mutase